MDERSGDAPAATQKSNGEQERCDGRSEEPAACSLFFERGIEDSVTRLQSTVRYRNVLAV